MTLDLTAEPIMSCHKLQHDKEVGHTLTAVKLTLKKYIQKNSSRKSMTFVEVHR